MKPYPPDAIVVVMVPMKSGKWGAHPFRRLARWLKGLGRGFGWRVLSIGPASAEAATLELLEDMPAMVEAAKEAA